MTPEDVARLFHETYERLAPDHGYRTRKASAVPWEDVPAANKSLMIAVAGELLPTIAAQVRAQVAAEQRAAAQAIEDSRGENHDPLATAIASGCRVHDTAPAVFDDARNIAIVAYRHLADRITQDEPVGARLALVTADNLAEILDYVVGRGDVRVVEDATISRAFAALKATLPRGEGR